MGIDTPTGHDSGRTSKKSTTICRIPVLPFVNKVKAGQTGPPEDRSRKNHAAVFDFDSTPRQLRPVHRRSDPTALSI
jgi:hypothetical protein